MKTKDFEKWVDAVNVTTESGSLDDLMYSIVSIGGEAGELLNYYKKERWHGNIHTQDMLLELGDIIHYAAKIAACLGSDLEDVMDMNVRKINERMQKMASEKEDWTPENGYGWLSPSSKDLDEWRQVREEMMKAQKEVPIAPFTCHSSATVEHPDHYTWHPKAECKDIAEHFSYNIGSAIAYLWRHDRKNGREDLEKALTHIRFEMDKLYPSSSSSNT